MSHVTVPELSRPSAIVTALAWLGGAWFVTALALYVWFFAVTLAAPGPDTQALAPAISWNVALFSAFALHHSVMARSSAKAWITRHVPPALERSIYVWVASSLLVAVTLLWRRVPGTLYVLVGPAAWAGWTVQLLGLVLTAAGARVLSARDLAGIRQATGAPAVGDIRVVWPFTLVRHPIYLGWVLTVFGAPVMTVDRFVWAAVSTAYLVIAIPWEERSLAAVAGEAYRRYQARVRWRLVPGLY